MWTEPLKLETWFINILSGDPEIFLVIALIAISSMAAYFRMNGIALFFVIGVFLLMFSTFINSPLIILISIFGGLLIGYILSEIFVGR